MEQFLTDIAFMIPEIFLSVSAMGLLLLGVFQIKEERASSVVSIIASIIFIFTLALVFMTWDRQGIVFNGLFVADSYASFLKVFILLGALAAIIMSRVDFTGARAWRFELPVLIMLSAVGMMIMVSANNYMTLYMGLELQSLALYVLAAIKRDNERSTEAGLKYFVLGALSSGLILFGMTFIYGYTGSLSFDNTGLILASSGINFGALIGMVFILAGIAFKISAVPFHMWTPDVYEGASTAITGFFATAPKIAAMGVLIRLVFDPLTAYAAEWQQLIIFMSVASMIVGAFAALPQKNIKRLLAFSSIGHIGYALMALCVSEVGALSSLLFYLSIYFFMSLGTFGLIIYLRHEDRTMEDIADFSGLAKSQPFMAFLMAIFMFSMAGIPPLAGFLAKLYVFNVVVEAGFIWLAIIGVLTSVVAAYYYLKIVKVMYFDEALDEANTVNAPFLRLVILLSAVVVVGLIFSPELLTAQTEAASLGLFLPLN